MEIREFRKTDIDIVFEIQRAAFKPLYEKYRDDINPYLESKETVLRKYMRDGTNGYLFLEEGKPTGTVRIMIDQSGKCGKVSALAVRPACQGRGIAQQALLIIEKLHPHVEKWYLDTILQERGNCHLYEKLGYVKTGKTEEIKDGMTLVFYEKVK